MRVAQKETFKMEEDAIATIGAIVLRCATALHSSLFQVPAIPFNHSKMSDADVRVRLRFMATQVERLVVGIRMPDVIITA